MRFMFALASLLVSTASFAVDGYLVNTADNESFQKACPGLKLSDGDDQVTCWRAENAREVAYAKVGDNVKPDGLNLDWFDVVAMDVWPDDSTSMMYQYTRALLSRYDGKTIGYMTIDGYQNSEMESRIKVTTRFNRKGKIVSVRVDSIN